MKRKILSKEQFDKPENQNREHPIVGYESVEDAAPLPEDQKLLLGIPKEALEFIKQISMRIEIANGGTYMYMPWWMEIKDEEKFLVMFHDFDHLPGELKGALMEMRLTENNLTDEDARKSYPDTAGE